MNIKVPVGGSKGWHKALPGCMQIACSESDRADVSVSALQWQRLVTSSGQLQLQQWRLTYQSSLWLIDRHPPTLPREERHWLRAAGELFISFWVWPRPTVSSSHTQTGRRRVLSGRLQSSPTWWGGISRRFTVYSTQTGNVFVGCVFQYLVSGNIGEDIK